MENVLQIQSEQINELATAMAKAQGTIMKAKEDKKNPFFKSSYADLGSVWEACRNSLSENGLSIIQTMQKIDGELNLVTTLMHASGQWMRSYTPIMIEKTGPQALGSAITYMKRYALSAMVGVVASSDDDDGERAQESYRKKKEIEEKPSEDDLINFFEIFDSLDTAYQDKVKNYIKEMGCADFCNLSKNKFETIRRSVENYANARKAG